MKQVLFCYATIAVAATSLAANTWYANARNYNEAYATPADYIAAGFDGTTADKGFGTIQAAIDASTTKAGDTILVCPGIYDKGGKMFTVQGTEYGFTRVVIGKSLTLESTHGASETHIVGKHADTENGLGDGFIRCVGQSWATSTLKGFTIRDGATGDGGDTAPNRGGAVYTQRGASPTYIVDCVISNCAAYYGVFRNGIIIRSLICDNFGANHGAAGVEAMFYSCIITGNRGAAGLVAAGVNSMEHCTVFGNATYTSVSVGTGGTARNNIIASSFSSSGVADVSGTTLSGNVCGAVDGIYQTIAPAIGDFRVLKGSVADLSRVNGADGSDMYRPVPEEYRNLDFYGKPIPAENACAGAVQEVVEAAGGALQFDNISSTAGVTVNGWKSIKSGAYLFPTNYPEQYLVGPALVSGKIYAWSTADGHGSCHLPDWKTDSLYLMPPPQTDVVMTNTLRLAAGEVWLDPEDGNDDNGTGTEERPYQTLQKGRDAAVADYTFVYCKKGNYDKGGSFYWGVTNRVYIGTRAVRFVGVDGASETFITGAADSNPPVETQPGCGSAAIRAIASGSCTSGFEGFTFRNCHSAAQMEGESAAVGHQGCVMRSGGSGVTIRDCVVEASCGAAANAFTGGRLERCWIKGLASGSAVYSDVTVVASCIENCKSSEYWPSGHGFHCAFRNSGTLAWNYACIGSGGARVRTDNAAKFASSVMHNYTTYEAGSTGYVTGDPLFASTTGPSVRRCSPAFTCGEVPTAENYGAEYYKYVSTDFYGRPLTFVDGKPVAGADQLGVFELFAHRHFTVTEATPHITEAVDGSISVPQGERLVASADAGVLSPCAHVLKFNVPNGGTLSISLNGEVHDFETGEHVLNLPKSPSAVKLVVSSDGGTSTLLALKREAGTMFVIR